MFWLWTATAGAWDAAELRPLDVSAIGAPHALAVSARFHGGPAIFVLGADGVGVFDGRSGARVQTATEPAGTQLLVHDLDGTGDAEVLVCGPSGISLLRGDREGLFPPSRLTTAACSGLAAFDVGTFDALVSIESATVATWTPSSAGLVRRDLGVASGAPLVAGSGPTILAAGADRRLYQWSGERSWSDDRGEVIAVAGLEPEGEAGRFAWVIGGGAPRVATPEGEVALGTAPTGLLAAPDGTLFVLDGPGRRVGVVADGQVTFVALPVSPLLAAASDLDADGCADLVVLDAASQGALLTGACGPTPPVVALAPVVVPPVAADPVADVSPAPSAESVAVVAPSDPEAPFVPDPLPPVVPPAPEPAPFAVPIQPAEHVFTDVWGVVHARVGDPLVVRVHDGSARARTYMSRGGPPGFAVQGDGLVEYEPVTEDIGRWRVSVRARGGSTHWHGFELQVWPAEGTVAVALPDGTPPERVGTVREPRSLGPLEPRSLQIGLGAAGGVAKAGGATWENLGGPDTRGALSPFASVVLAGGAPTVQWFVGLDSAPFVSYAAVPKDRQHVIAPLLGVQAGGGAVMFGVYGTYGATIRGVGTRVNWTGWKDWRDQPMGLEGRLLWLAPQLGAEATVAWVWAL